ncbi:MAG: sulfatase-like hydrolase/transferase [Candidatus Saccharibacteria bacterium]|nr:sulfatase-like hydrolase/transferase [Candidatus Saccharibacteria bacterium]
MLKFCITKNYQTICTHLKSFWQVNLKSSWQTIVRSPFYQLLFSLIATTFFSLVITFFIFQTYNNSLDLSMLTWLFNDANNQVFMWSWVIIFLIDVVLLAIFNRTILANLILIIISIVWLFVDQIKMTSRQTPFLPEDLFLIGEAKQMTSLIQTSDFYFLIRNLILIFIMSLSAYFIYHLLMHYPKPSRRRRWLVSSLLAVIGVGGLINIYQQLRDPNLMTTHNNLIHNAIINCCPASNYYWNGPVVGFISNIGKITLDRPSEYSEDNICQIVQKYQPVLTELKQKTPTEPINIVLILSESLTDPMLFQDYYAFKQDPIPFTHWLQQNRPSGWLTTTEYGGGTANVESDVLTSLSSTFNNNTTPFTHFLPKIKNFPSLASTLKSFGYSTSALHNYTPQMYKRHLVYPNIGIDNFYDISSFSHTQAIDRNTYDSDSSFFATLLEHLQQNSEQPKFINGITMQNHAPYDNIYNLTTQWTEQDNLSDDEYNRLENYLTGINYSDQALQQFYRQLQQINQKTLVLIYGDHLPGSGVFSRVAEADQELAHLTPIITLANFDLKFKNFDKISANYLATTIFEALDWPKSGYYTMLDQIRQKYPALTNYHAGDNEILAADPTYLDYALIQYDLLNGKRYSQKLGFFDIKNND